MLSIKRWTKKLHAGELDQEFRKLLVIADNEPIPTASYQRFEALLTAYRELFARDLGEAAEIAFFSAPGRTELIGNHTDHQHGKVIAAAVNLDVWAVAAPNSENCIRFQSEGWPLLEITAFRSQPDPLEKGTTAALLRGIIAGFWQKGFPIGGLDIYCQSNVLPGSGLSSSAAIEVLIAVILNHFYAADQVAPKDLATIGQWAENQYFSKPSGLMDQMASALGSAVFMDFADPKKPGIRRLDLNLQTAGYALTIVDSGADHADLTAAYAAIPEEMQEVAAYFGKTVLAEVSESDFLASFADLRSTVGDRSMLRALHFFSENKRVELAAKAIDDNDYVTFLNLIEASGRSSFDYLQNVLVSGSVRHQEIALALAAAEKCLAGKGAFRVHGGGFAGTIQAFVPKKSLTLFCSDMNRYLGRKSCHPLEIRSVGGYVLSK